MPRELLREFRGTYDWRGSVPKYAVDHYFKNGDVLVLPSLSDSWGLVVTEAMSCGLPVIVTTNTGAPVRDEVEGFVIPPADSTELGERLRFLYEHAAVRREMGMRGRERVLAAYTWEHYRERIVNAYDGLLSDHDASRAAVRGRVVLRGVTEEGIGLVAAMSAARFAEIGQVEFVESSVGWSS